LVGKKPKDAGFTIIRAHARERVKSRPPLPPPIHVKKPMISGFTKCKTSLGFSFFSPHSTS